MKKLLILLILILSVSAFAADLDKKDDLENDNIYLYSTWDSNFLYFGCEVQCPNVIAKNKQFNQPIGDDDGLEIVIDLANSRAQKIKQSCYSFSASAAGGFEFKKGTDSGVFVKENIFSHKIAANVIGTLNNSTDIDSGFVIELALPWDILTDMVPENQTISFSYKVRVGGKDYCLTDIDKFYSPASWYNMMITTYTSSFGTKIQNRITCGTYLTNAPTVDGVIKQGEWNKKSRSNIKIPIDKNLYKLTFKSQKVIAKNLVLKDGTSFLDDIRRVDVLKKNILAMNPVDVLYVPVDDNLSHILEALRAVYGETGTIIPLVPIISAKDDKEFIEELNKFLLVIPNQFRFISSDTQADKCLFVKCDSKKIDYNVINSNYTAFKVSNDTSYAISKRITSEYAYIFTGYEAPKNLSLTEPDQFNFVIKNVGSIAWKPLDVSIAYRWYKNDRFYSQGFMPIPITKEVKPGETLVFNTSVMPVNYMNKPLQEGDVVLEVELVQNDTDKLITSQSLMLKTTISGETVDNGLKVVSVDMTKKQELNKSYDILLDVQNSSLKPIEKGDALYAYLCEIDENGEIVKAYDNETCLIYATTDVPVGIVGKFRGKLKFTKGKKDNAKDIENSKFVLAVAEKVDKGEFYVLHLETVEFIENDFNEKIVLASEFPSEVVKETQCEVKVLVRNAGKTAWSNDAKVIANWYNDRGEMTDNGGFVKISKGKVKPGETKMLTLTVFTPSKKGKYNLVCGIYANGRYLSSVDADRSNNMIVVPVTVVAEEE